MVIVIVIIRLSACICMPLCCPAETSGSWKRPLSTWKFCDLLRGLGVGTSYNLNPFEITEKRHFIRTSSRMKALVMCCGHTLGWPLPPPAVQKWWVWHFEVDSTKTPFVFNESSLARNCILSCEQWGMTRMTVGPGAKWPNSMTT